jgi:hypothetical protein
LALIGRSEPVENLLRARPEDDPISSRQD